eukprot:TRINITY_DN5112_c0_g1_i2.p1 TRINITY_DN5112_c0_g1~~TRINITY_DN5112_c0_g1_i2.p1  ORF type:complete len:860 (-),score=45.75 TRINITY_DN5112_c0_g1_i2:9-2507(-)
MAFVHSFACFVFRLLLTDDGVFVSRREAYALSRPVFSLLSEQPHPRVNTTPLNFGGKNETFSSDPPGNATALNGRGRNATFSSLSRGNATSLNGRGGNETFSSHLRGNATALNGGERNETFSSLSRGNATPSNVSGKTGTFSSLSRGNATSLNGRGRNQTFSSLSNGNATPLNDPGRNDTLFSLSRGNATFLNDRGRNETFSSLSRGNATALSGGERNEAFSSLSRGNATPSNVSGKTGTFSSLSRGNATSLNGRGRNQTFSSLSNGNATPLSDPGRNDTFFSLSRGNATPSNVSGKTGTFSSLSRGNATSLNGRGRNQTFSSLSNGNATPLSDPGRNDTFFSLSRGNATPSNVSGKTGTFSSLSRGNTTSLNGRGRNQTFSSLSNGNATPLNDPRRNDMFSSLSRGNATFLNDRGRNETFSSLSRGNATPLNVRGLNETFSSDPHGNTTSVNVLGKNETVSARALTLKMQEASQLEVAITGSTGRHNLCIGAWQIPDFYVLGVQKCATTSFSKDLINVGVKHVHGDKNPKEFHFFNHRLNYSWNESFSKQRLLKWMPACPPEEEIVDAADSMSTRFRSIFHSRLRTRTQRVALADFTPDYLRIVPLPRPTEFVPVGEGWMDVNRDGLSMPIKLRELYGNKASKKLRFAILIREPLKQMQSAWYHAKSFNFSNACRSCNASNFTSALQSLVEGLNDSPKRFTAWLWTVMYGRHLEHWFNHFRPSQFYIIPQAEYTNNGTRIVCRNISSIIDADINCDNQSTEATHAWSHGHPSLEKDTSKWLWDQFDDAMSEEHRRLVRVLARAHEKGLTLAGYGGRRGSRDDIDQWLASRW